MSHSQEDRDLVNAHFAAGVQDADWETRPPETWVSRLFTDDSD